MSNLELTYNGLLDNDDTSRCTHEFKVLYSEMSLNGNTTLKCSKCGITKTQTNMKPLENFRNVVNIDNTSRSNNIINIIININNIYKKNKDEYRKNNYHRCEIKKITKPYNSKIEYNQWGEPKPDKCYICGGYDKPILQQKGPNVCADCADIKKQELPRPEHTTMFGIY